MLKVLLAGGGTAGHINPALAIASIIKERREDAEFLFVGTPDKMEATLIPREGYAFAPMKISGFQRKLSIKNIGRNIRTVYYLSMSSSRAKKIIKEFEPDLVIGTGGYVSGPVVRQAAKMGIPTAIHEQNAYPGVTTRILTKKVDAVMLTMEGASEYFDKDIQYTVTGLPVRKGFASGSISREAAKKELGLDNSLTILSFGGSLGAGAINEVAPKLMKWEQESGLNINHIHSYGKMGHDTFEKTLAENGVTLEGNDRLIVKEYIYNMDVCTAAADIIICRCGAATISELEAIGRASILIPSPVVAGNHQYHNAMTLGNVGAAIVIEQKNLTAEKLIEHIKDFYENPEKITAFEEKAKELCIKDTADKIWGVLSKLI